MQKSVFLLLTIVFLDAVSLGFVFTNLPNLLQTLGGDSASLYGIAMTCYAGLQFLCSPVLGSISDRIGRKPVLMLSIFGGLMDFSAMAFASTIWVVFAGRMIAGCVSGNTLLISAFLADTTTARKRTAAFGWMFAAFGAGLGVGPLAGGMVAELSSRAPFLAAAALSMASLAIMKFGILDVPGAGRPPTRINFLNPLALIRRTATDRSLWPYMALYLALSATGSLTAILWPLYGPDKFDWSATTLGASIAALSVFTLVTQGVLLERLAYWFGDRLVLMVGAVFDCVAMSCLAMVTSGWMIFALTPLLGLGGLGLPALQSLISKKSREADQGSVQGTLASLNSLMMTITPLVATSIYSYRGVSDPSLTWLLGTAIYLLAAPLAASIMRDRSTHCS